jgi:hypothetical protein
MGSRYADKQKKKKKSDLRTEAQLKQENATMSLVDRIRKANKGLFLWKAVPLFRKDGKPLKFTKLSPFLPCRTRDGRAAFIIEIDERRATMPVTVEAVSTTSKTKAHHKVTLNGSFLASGEPHPLDIFNITPEKWNKKFEKGEVPIKAL